MIDEPTEAQVEAAAKAIWERYAGHGPWDTLPETRKSPFLKDARTALEAAQGAAPQAEGVPKSTYISPNLPGMIRNLWKSDPSENSVRTALKLAGDLIQELIDLRAAPVLPSSTVDEGKIAEVVREAKTSWLRACGTPGHVEDIDVWITRAVVEAIGGEGCDATDEN